MAEHLVAALAIHLIPLAEDLPTPRWSIKVLKGALGCLLFAVLGWYVDPHRLWASLVAVEGQVLWVSLALGGVGIAIQVAKWRLLLRRFRPGISWNEAWRSLLAGFGLGMFSPGRLGELGRGVVLDGDQGILVGLSAVDRASSAIVTLVLGWLGLVLLWPALGLGALVVVLAVVGGAARLWPRLRQRASLRRWAGPAGALLAGIDRGGWVGVGCWSLVFNLLFCGQFLLLLCSWGDLPSGAVLAVPVFFALKLLLPFTVMDIGVREAVALLVFTPLGLEPAIAFNAAFIQFVINVILPGIGGWFLLYGRMSRRLGGQVPLRGLADIPLETRR